jgi:hypothetical protein
MKKPTAFVVLRAKVTALECRLEMLEEALSEVIYDRRKVSNQLEKLQHRYGSLSCEMQELTGSLEA